MGTHNQYQAYKWYEEYELMQDMRERERELEIVDQTQTQRYVSRFEHPALRPCLHQKDFHYIVHTGLPTQGTFTEDLGKNN